MSKSFETDLNKSKLNEDCCCHAAVHLDFKLDRNLKALLLHHLEWNLEFSARKASLSGFRCMLYPSGLLALICFFLSYKWWEDCGDTGVRHNFSYPYCEYEKIIWLLET